MLRHAHLIVRRLIARVMAKSALLPTLVVTRLRVVISRIVVSVVLRHVKIAHQLVTALIVRPSMIVRIGVRVRSVARVTVIRVRPGAAMIAPLRAVNMLTQRLRNVANLHRVLSVPTAPVMTTCRFSAHRAQTQRHVVRVPSSRTTIALSVAATSPQAQR